VSRHSHKRPISDFGLRTSFGFRISDFGFQLKTLLSTLILALALQPGSLWACAACYGQSDSPMAKGMNWGILSLLAMVAMVLGGVAAFFVYLARRSATVAAEPAKSKPGRASVPASPNFSGNAGKSGLAGTLALPHRTAPLLESTHSAL
jgi:hypothetical protein